MDPGIKSRYLVAEWLAIQHYVSGDDDPFGRAVAELARATEPSGFDATDAFLSHVLEANNCVTRNDYSTAKRIYEEQIVGQQSRLDGLSQEKNTEERREFEFRSTVLALLHNNLAEAIEYSDPDSARVEELFHKAIEYQPSLPFTRESLGHHFTRHRQWDRAREMYDETYRLMPSKTAGTRRMQNIAELQIARAEAMDRDGETDTAIAILLDSIRDLSDPEATLSIARTNETLGRLYRAQNRHSEAIASYRAATTAYESHDPRQAAAQHMFLGDYLVELKREPEAAQEFQSGLDSVERIQDQLDREWWLTQLEARLWAISLTFGKPLDADRALKSCRATLTRVNHWDPYVRIISVIGPMLARSDVKASVKARLDELIRSADSPRELRHLVDGLRELWKGAAEDVTLDHKTAWESPDGKHLITVATPIAMQLDEQVLKAVGGEESFVKRLEPELRQPMEKRFGVSIPGVRVRSTEHADTPGSYTFFINETPLASGAVITDSRFCLDPSPGLKAMRRRPPRAPAGRWVGEEEALRLSAQGHAVIDASTYILRHLEGVLAANLVAFVGHQEVQNLIETHKIVVPGRSYDIVSTETYRHMDPLTNVVRCLVQERVPIVDFEAIYKLFHLRWQAGSPVSEIVDAVRMLPQVRFRLWGNNLGYRLFLLGANTESLIALSHCDRRLELPSTTVTQLLDHVSRSIDVAASPAIVVRRKRYRAVVRMLLSGELREVPVLALRELMPEVESRIEEIPEMGDAPSAGTTGNGPLPGPHVSGVFR